MKLHYSHIVCAFGIIISLIFLATFSPGDEIAVSIMGVFAGFIVFCIGIALLAREMNKTELLELQQIFERDLAEFDAQDLNDISQRKVAFLTLYDLYQRLLSKVGVQYCKILQNQLEEYPLTELWDQVRSIVLKAERIPTQWGKTIQTLRNMHMNLSKKDRTPSKLDLEQIREKTPEFIKWVLMAGNKYQRMNKDVIGMFFSTQHS